MELSYINPTKSLIVAHLDAGEELGTLSGGEHGKTEYIKVDGSDENYRALLEKDPTLESVVDPGEPRMPPPAEGPAPGAGEHDADERKAAAQHRAEERQEDRHERVEAHKPQAPARPQTPPARPMAQQPAGRPPSQPQRQEPPKR